MTSLIERHRHTLGYQAALLGGACFVVSLLLLLSNGATKETIDHHALNDRKVLLQQVLPAALYDNEPLLEPVPLTDAVNFNGTPTLYVARKNGTLNGGAIAANVQGWGGPIDFILAVDGAGAITGVRVISHKETPGLADKIEIEKSEWITAFDGKSLTNTAAAQWAVKKDQGEFDQFTGATITPRALVGGLHRALLAYDQWRAQQPSTETEAAP